MFKRKLFKRALPVILSVAMIFQSTPATALAAENAETEAIVETAEGAEPSDDSSDAGSADSSEPSEVSPASEDAPTADGNSEEQAKKETEGQSTETTKAEESKNDESKAETAQTEESKEEGTSTEASTTEEAPSETVAENQGTETTTTAAEESTEAVVEATSEVEADGEAADVNAEQAALDTVIKADLNSVDEVLSNVCTRNPEDVFVTTYTGKSSTYADITTSLEAGKNSFIKITIDGAEDNDLNEELLKGSVHMAWKKVLSDGKTEDISFPVETGQYQLLITLDAVDGICKESTTTINFEIEQIQLQIDNVSEIDCDGWYDDDYNYHDTKPFTIAPGTTVGELKEQLKENYRLYYIDAESDNADEDGKVYIPKDTMVAGVDIVVIDSYDTAEEKTALDDAVVLKKNNNYRVFFKSITLVDTAKENYQVANLETLYEVKFSDLVKTKVVVEKNKPLEDITVIYNKDATDEELNKVITDAVKSVKVFPQDATEDDENAQIKLPEGEELSLQWCTGNIDISNDNDSEITYNPLESVPKDAGEYYVRYEYKGEEGAYEGSFSDAIKVTIEPISLLLKPSSTIPAFQAGMNKAEVAKALATVGYELYPYETDAAGKITLGTKYTENENFWGVAYNDKNKTQYYRPVFELEYRKALKNEDGTSVIENNVIQYSDWTVWNEAALQASEGKEKEYEYRIVFSGNKAVFNANGEIVKTVSATDTSTMEAEKNYAVKTDEATRHIYSDKEGELSLVVPVEVKASKEVEIDITGIIDGFKTINADIKDKNADGSYTDIGLSEENPLWKVYDENALYTKRADYKKAAIKEDGKASSLKEGESLAYTWQYKYGDGETDWSDVGSEATDSELEFYADRLKKAGLYRLTITFQDTSHARFASEKVVYFEVKRQEVMVVGDFAGRVGKDKDSVNGPYRVYKLPNNNEAKLLELLKLPDESEEKKKAAISADKLFPNKTVAESKSYLDNILQFEVQRQEKDDAGKDTGHYIDMEDGELFVEGYTYQVYAYIPSTYLYNDANYTNVDVEETIKNTENKTIYHYKWNQFEPQKVGTEKLAVVVDESKFPKSKVYDGEVVTLPTEGLFKLVLANDHAQEVKGLTIGTAKDWFDYVEGSTTEKKDIYYGFAYNKGNSRNADFYYDYPVLDADKYYLAVWSTGTETYADFDYVFNGEDELNEYSFEITPQPLTIKPVLNTAELAAGECVGNLYNGLDYEVIEGKIADIDSDDFTEGYWYDEDGDFRSGFYAFDGHFDTQYQYDGVEVDEQDYLRYGKTYQVSIANSSLVSPYDRNYDITYVPATYKVTQRGNSEVSEGEYYDDNKETSFIDSVRLTDTIDGYSHTIVPIEGIPFYYDVDVDVVDQDKNLTGDGNFIAFRIYAPREFTDRWNAEEFSTNVGKFLYKEDIKNNGGYLLNEFTAEDEYDENDKKRHYITVLFDVTDVKYAAEADKKKEFSICWEDGYVEKFTLDLSKAILEDNLKAAVAPKSLAFNGINNKMVIGEEQNLDVKITKVQLGDIISIAYETDNPKVLSIDKETGHVTALQVSKPVTVTAYAYKLDKDGKEERLGKAATAKISVTDVTAPAIKKIDTIRDDGATIHYTKVDNGYRRELYVLKGKQTEAAFKTEIEKLEKGQANALVKVVYNIDSRRDGHDEDDYWIYDDYKSGKSTVFKYTITGLVNPDKAEQEYSVYIRNVSAVRTLADGSSVKLSSKGVVKNFKTTKPQVKELSLYTEDQAATSKKDLDDKLAAEGVYNPLAEYEYDYGVALTSKKIQMTVDGLFKDYDTSADGNDLVTMRLPIKGKSDYLNPKLTYEVYDYNGISDDAELITDTVSKYAAINKKGQLTFKGVGLNGFAKVQVSVSADNDAKIGTCDIIIVAAPDKVKTKNAKLKVGDSIVITDYLNYTEGRTKVLNYVSSGLVIVNREELESNGVRVESEYLRDYNTSTYRLVATKDGKFDVKVRDTNLKAHQEDLNAFVTIKLTVGKLDPVKSLKTAYVDDNRITVNFAHAGNPSDFLIVVEDGRGSLVSRKLVSAENVPHISATAVDYIQEDQRHIVDELTYFEKTKMYAYTIDNSKFIRQSSYKISVTAIYDGVEAKTAVTKTKTTNIPASKYNMAAREWGRHIEDPEDRYYRIYGGETIWVTDTWSGDNKIKTSISQKPYLSSGNTYTLMLDANEAAKSRITDTLTWKSSDTKVATIKANAGTYNATLKALKQGTTTIEVTSKITKKVIARYLIAVNPVANAGNYYGDWEEEWFRQYDPLYNGTVEVLTLSNDVTAEKVNSFETPYAWVSFTAPKFGEYTFTSTNYYTINDGINASNSSYASKPDYWGDDYTNYSYGARKFLEAGQQIYFKVNKSFTLHAAVKEFDKLEVGTPLDVTVGTNGTWISFVAPEDNYYTFKSSDEDAIDGQIRVIKNSNLYTDQLEPKYENDSWIYGRGMKAGESILLKVDSSSTITVEKRVNIEAKALVADGKDVPMKLTNEENEKWFQFTAPATAEYTFEVSETSTVEFYSYADITNGELSPLDNSARVTRKSGIFSALANIAVPFAEAEQPKLEKHILKLNQDDVILVKITLKEELPEDKTEQEVIVKVSKPEVKALTNPENITLGNNEAIWRSFKVEKEGYYTFTATDKDKNVVRAVTYYNNNMEELVTTGSYDLTVPSEEVKVGDTIYLKITDNVTITVKEVKAEELKTGNANAKKVEFTGKSGVHEQWYTFTAPHDGNYVFRFESSQIAAEEASTVLTNILDADKYDKIFGEAKEDFSGMWENHGISVSLSAGEKITLKLQVNDTDESKKLTGFIYVDDADGNTSAASIKTGENQITLDKVKGITNWYAFETPKTDTYAFTWKSDDKSGEVELGLYDSMTSTSKKNMDSAYLYAGKVYYIKAVQKTDTKVSGKLNISGTPASEKVQNGTVQFANLANNASKSYTFTAPQTTRYAITVAMADKKTADIWFDDSNIGTYAEQNLVKGRTYTMSVTATSDKSSGTVTIKPIALTAIKAAGNITAKKDGIPSWYVFTVEKAGRYNLMTENTDKMEIEFYNKLDSEDSVSGMGLYYEAGEQVFIKASTSENTDQTTKFTPEIVLKDIKVEDKNGQTVSITKGTVGYYWGKITSAGYYTITTELPKDKGVAASSIMYAVNTDNSYSDISTIGTTDIMLEQGDIIYVRVFATDEADTNFTMKMTKREEKSLIIGKDSEEVTLAPWESERFSLPVIESGKFIFEAVGITADDKTQSVNLSHSFPDGCFIDNTSDGYEGVYFGIEAKYNSTVSFSVTNNSSTKVTFKINTKRFTDEEYYTILTEEKAIENINLTKNKLKWITFTAPKDGRYTFKTTGADAKLYKLDYYHMESVSDPEWLYKGDTITLLLTYVGSEAKGGTVGTEVTHLEPQGIKGTGELLIKVSKDTNVTWFEYTAEKAAEYTFVLKQGENNGYMTPYNSIASSDGSYNTLEYTKKLGVGETFVFTIDNEDSEKDQEYTLSVETTKELQLYKMLKFKTYGDVYEIEFTAPETRTYKITGFTPDDGDFWVEYYADKDDKKYDDRKNVYGDPTSAHNNLSMYKSINKGDTIRIKVYTYASSYQPDLTDSYRNSISIEIE